MRTVDAALRPLGSVIPQYLTVPTAARIHQWFLACGAYPTPPGSGNAYARWFLEAVGPFDLSLDRAADSLLLPLAPLYGDVVTVPEILVSYRVHGQNLGAQRVFDPAKPGIELRRTQARWRYAREHAKRLSSTAPMTPWREPAGARVSRGLAGRLSRAASDRGRSPDPHHRRRFPRAEPRSGQERERAAGGTGLDHIGLPSASQARHPSTFLALRASTHGPRRCNVFCALRGPSGETRCRLIRRRRARRYLTTAITPRSPPRTHASGLRLRRSRSGRASASRCTSAASTAAASTPAPSPPLRPARRSRR